MEFKKKEATQKVAQALIAVYNEINHKILHYWIECADYFKVIVHIKNLKYICGVSCRVLEISSPFSNVNDSENKRRMKSSTAACLSRKCDPVAQDDPRILLWGGFMSELLSLYAHQPSENTEGGVTERDVNVSDVLLHWAATLASLARSVIWGSLSMDMVDSRPCLFVCLSAGLRKNYLADLHQTRTEHQSRPRIEPINFLCWSRLSDKFLKMYSHFHRKFICFSGKNAWIQMRRISVGSMRVK